MELWELLSLTSVSALIFLVALKSIVSSIRSLLNKHVFEYYYLLFFVFWYFQAVYYVSVIGDLLGKLPFFLIFVALFLYIVRTVVEKKRKQKQVKKKQTLHDMVANTVVLNSKKVQTSNQSFNYFDDDIEEKDTFYSVLKKLQELNRIGVLTDDEYKEKKDKLIERDDLF